MLYNHCATVASSVTISHKNNKRKREKVTSRNNEREKVAGRGKSNRRAEYERIRKS